MTTTTDTLTSAPTRRPGTRRTPTQERTMPDQPSEVEYREYNGQTCTNRAGIAILAGITGGRAIDVRAGREPDFPKPVKTIGRTHWYPLIGPHGVNVYIQLLQARGEAGLPPQVEDGDPHDLLGPEEAAAALHIDRATLDGYVKLSKPHWDAWSAGEQLPGHPPLPTPDVTTTLTNTFGEYERREWYRDTLTRHQASRPGLAVNRGATRDL